MDGYDEVDFWGGESPGTARHTSPPLARANGDGMVVEVESEEDGEDSDDEVMNDGEAEEEEEGGEAMEMELFGHR